MPLQAPESIKRILLNKRIPKFAWQIAPLTITLGNWVQRGSTTHIMGLIIFSV